MLGSTSQLKTPNFGKTSASFGFGKTSNEFGQTQQSFLAEW